MVACLVCFVEGRAQSLLESYLQFLVGSLTSPFQFTSLFPHPKVTEEEDIPKKKERTHFTVRLTEAKPVDKVKLIKEIKNYVQGINLVQVGPHSPS